MDDEGALHGEVVHDAATMQLETITLARCAEASGVVVIIDVLRAFTTAAHALGAGAAEVVCVGSVADALAERERWPGSLVMGEVGGRPVDGFDLSNSPSALSRVDVRGRTLIQRTSAGTQGVVGSVAATALFATSFACAAGTARAVAALRPDRVTFVATGVDDRDGEEDLACADYLAALLSGPPLDPAPYLARVRGSDAARPFLAGDDPDFPGTDVEAACQVDVVDFALRAHLEGGRPVLRPDPAAERAPEHHPGGQTESNGLAGAPPDS